MGASHRARLGLPEAGWPVIITSVLIAQHGVRVHAVCNVNQDLKSK